MWWRWKMRWNIHFVRLFGRFLAIHVSQSQRETGGKWKTRPTKYIKQTTKKSLQRRFSLLSPIVLTFDGWCMLITWWFAIFLIINIISSGFILSSVANRSCTLLEIESVLSVWWALITQHVWWYSIQWHMLYTAPQNVRVHDVYCTHGSYVYKHPYRRTYTYTWRWLKTTNK